MQTILDYRPICPVFSCEPNDQLNVCEGISCTNNLLIKTLLKRQLIFYQHKLLKEMTSKNVDYYISPSPHLKHCLELNGFSPVTRISLFSSKLINTNSSFNSINWKMILFVGQLEANKGIWNLVKAIKSIKETHPQILLKVAGTGSQKKRLGKLCTKII